MNFRKVEVIFIIAFLILDIFLVNIFLDKYIGTFNQAIASQSVDIATELQTNNISYDEPSDEVLATPFIRTINKTITLDEVLSVTSDTQSVEVVPESNQIVSQINEPVPLNGVGENTVSGTLSDDALSQLDAFVDSEVYDGNMYQFVTYDQNAGTILYMKQSAANYPIADGSGEIVFQVNENYAVYGYDQTVTGESATQGEDRTVITQAQAIENAFLNNSIPDDARIVTSFLSYRQTLVLEEITLYHPVWTLFIQASEGTTQRVYVDAINGSILTQ
ncbi:hypothetical protein EF384_04085 [Aerococcus agrisoli]|uniref:Regulatory protein YycH-like domain-containing protein n=1 Tax=Aerococcus agrisoli TaxID=2487350 RepID=A0A3N4GD80_9LACT|nr:two-component system regulatory protein YycI [Aerococcus agrisoli]RPA60749.1 hypothetical protein EF384_04085 [Aerococcus agrisoli]